MSKRKRVSLSTRLQPYSGTLLAEVVEWLNSKERDEKNNLIADAVVMAYLPYARACQDVSKTEIERCCWETQDMLDKHGFKYHSILMGKPRGGNYHWIDNHLVKATRYTGKFTELVERVVTIEVFDDGKHD